MKGPWNAYGSFALFMVVLLALIGTLGGCGKQQGQQAGGISETTAGSSAMDEMLAAAKEAFWDAEFQTAERLSQSVLSASEAQKEDRVEAYKIQAAAYTMRRVRSNALNSLVRMFELDRTARYSPPTDYPPPVLQNYYVVRDSLFSGTMDINTVAVGDFETNSIYTGKFKNYDFGALEKALPHIIMLDLTEITQLKVVDRQRTTDILRELQLTESGFADPGQAVRTGKLLGAHTFIFGQYMLLSADQVRIDARIVQTATGEVLTARQITGKFSGKPEVFLELQEKLITELVRTLETSLGSQILPDPVDEATKYYAQKKDDVKSREGYVDGVFLTSQALDAEERGDYVAAVENWKRVLSVDPENQVAATRIKVLTPLAKG